MEAGGGLGSQIRLGATPRSISKIFRPTSVAGNALVSIGIDPRTGDAVLWGLMRRIDIGQPLVKYRSVFPAEQAKRKWVIVGREFQGRAGELERALLIPEMGFYDLKPASFIVG